MDTLITVIYFHSIVQLAYNTADTPAVTGIVVDSPLQSKQWLEKLQNMLELKLFPRAPPPNTDNIRTRIFANFSLDRFDELPD